MLKTTIGTALRRKRRESWVVGEISEECFNIEVSSSCTLEYCFFPKKKALPTKSKKKTPCDV